MLAKRISRDSHATAVPAVNMNPGQSIGPGAALPVPHQPPSGLAVLGQVHVLDRYWRDVVGLESRGGSTRSDTAAPGLPVNDPSLNYPSQSIYRTMHLVMKLGKW